MTIVEQIFPQFMVSFFEFLATPICLYIQIWTIWHFLVGGLVYYLIRKEEKPLLLLLGLLVLFEFFEFGLSYGFDFLIKMPFILKELWQDSFLDVVFGFLGGFLVSLFLKIKE